MNVMHKMVNHMLICKIVVYLVLIIRKEIINIVLQEMIQNIVQIVHKYINMYLLRNQIVL